MLATLLLSLSGAWLTGPWMVAEAPNQESTLWGKTNQTAEAEYAAGPVAPVQGKPVSLEQLLKKARKDQAAAQAPIGARVQEILIELNQENLKDSRLKGLSSELKGMGPAAGPLLVPGLDPGTGANGTFLARADRLQNLLGNFEDLGTTLALLEAALGEAPEYSERALMILRNSPHHRIVAETLAQHVDWESPLSAVRPYLATVSSLGGPEAAWPLEQALETKNKQNVVWAIRGLALQRNPHVGKAMLNAVQRFPDYTVLRETASYFFRVPERLAAGDTLRLEYLRLAAGIQRPLLDSLPTWERDLYGNRPPTPAPDLIVQVLQFPLEIKGSTALREMLWDWVEANTARKKPLLRLLAKVGDSKGKRAYMEPLQSAVQNSKREDEDVQSEMLSNRAKGYLEIGDASNALRDSQKAIKLAKKDPPSWDIRQSTFVTAATAAAIKGRHKEAAEHLEEASLDNAMRKKLREKPAFFEFLRSRYAYALE